MSGTWQWAADLVIHDGENTDAPIIAANWFDGDGNMQANGPYNASNSSGALTITTWKYYYYDCEDTCNGIGEMQDLLQKLDVLRVRRYWLYGPSS